MPHKDTRLDANEEFTLVADPIIENDILRSHQVLRGTLKDSDMVFVWKEIKDPALAQLELLAQEFFRLIIPHQPITYLAVDKTTGVHYILSQEVAGYKPLPAGQAQKFKEENGFSGLGMVCLVALFIQEIDLKNGNLGLNDKNQVIKIDGDRCFSALKKLAEVFKISPEGINNLPYPKDFYAYNWLDLIRHGIASPASSIISNDLSKTPKFRAEVNQAILLICLLPDAFIEQFVDAYIAAGGERFVKLIKERREELKNSALKNPSFVNYLATPAATTQVDSFISHMKNFKANRTEKVTNLADLDVRVKAQMQSLQTMVQQAKILITETNLLLTQFRAVDTLGKNTDLDSYLLVSEKSLTRCGHDPAQLLALKSELTKKLPLAKDANARQQSQKMMGEVNSIIDDIRSIVPSKQDVSLDQFIEAQKELLKSAWLDSDALTKVKKDMNAKLIAELIKASTKLFAEIERMTKNKQATISSHNEITTYKDDPIALQQVYDFHLELYTIYRSEELVKENEALVAQIKEFVASDLDTELLIFLDNTTYDINHCDQEPLKLEDIKKSLVDKLAAMPALLKKDCHSLLEDIKEDINLDEKYKERLKTNDPKLLMRIKIELTAELSVLLSSTINHQLNEIRAIPAAQKDISIENYIKDSEDKLDKAGANPQLLKTILGEIGDKHHEILQSIENKKNAFNVMKDKMHIIRDNQTTDTAKADLGVKERLAQIKNTNPPTTAPSTTNPPAGVTG